MKKAISFIIIFFIVFSLVIYNLIENNSIKVTIEKSERFNEEEIKDAIDAVKIKFKGFDGCKLTDIWYDEKKSEKYSKVYLEYGGGNRSGYTEKDVITLLSNFKVRYFGGDGSLEPNSTYDDWQWIVVKDKNTGKWNVVSSGY